MPAPLFSGLSLLYSLCPPPTKTRQGEHLFSSNLGLRLRNNAVTTQLHTPPPCLKGSVLSITWACDFLVVWELFSWETFLLCSQEFTEVQRTTCLSIPSARIKRYVPPRLEICVCVRVLESKRQPFSSTDQIIGNRKRDPMAL